MVEALQLGDPHRVGRYILLNRLGTGGMGRVFLGQSPDGRLVAVKLIRPDLADNPDFRQRFTQEVTAARRVGGSFTAAVVDADPDCQQPWLATEFVDGPPLSEAVARRGAMPAESVLMLARGLAEGLREIHVAGLIHRDLKPSNVLLAGDGPRIIDFGVCRAADSALLTTGRSVMGSPGFMSPEQAEGGDVGAPADIFSLGSVLAFAATGEPPFGHGTAPALLYRVVFGEAATGYVPPELRPMVKRCLAKDPAARPTAEDLLAELGAVEPAASWAFWADRPRHAAGSPARREAASTVRRESNVPQQHLDRATAMRHRPWRRARPRARMPRRPAGPAGVVVAAALAVIVVAAVGTVVALTGRPGPSAPPQSAAPHRLNPAPSPPVASSTPSPPSSPSPRSSPTPRNGRSAALRPAAVVEAYYAAVNMRDWAKVWRLGGKHLSPSFRSMVVGYQTTEKDVISSIKVTGNRVMIRIRAYQTDGNTLSYQAAYQVSHGTITAGMATLLGSAP